MLSCQRLWSCSTDFFQQLITRKPYYEIQREIYTNNKLKRSVTSIPMIALGLGGMIGEYY